MSKTKTKILRATTTHTTQQVNDYVFEYQQTRDSTLLGYITDACTPIILKTATKYATKYGKDIYEVVSDMVQVLYKYIDKYKPSKYHFLQSFNMFLRYNKNLCLCNRPERVPIKLSDDEKKKSIKELNATGISKSRNGKTFYATMHPSDMNELLISKFANYSDDVANITSIVEMMISGDYTVYFELATKGYRDRDIVSSYKHLFVDKPEDMSITAYIESLKGDLRDIYSKAVDYYNGIFENK